MISAATGLLAVVAMIVWYYQSKQTGHPISFLYVPATGMLTTTLAGYLISFLSSRQSAERLRDLTWWT